METTINSANDWQLLLRAAEQGDAAAQLEVARQYENGITIKGKELLRPDAEKAFKWTKRAYDSGNTEAAVCYADYLSAGIHCKKDKALAMKLYEAGVKAGSARAARSLGIEHRDLHNYEKAFQLYRKADDGDLATGMCYYYGVGVEQDRRKAFRFFKKLLKSGAYLSGYEINEAHYMLGKMYLEGEAVTRSVNKARQHLLLANEDNDHSSAQQILWVIGLK